MEAGAVPVPDGRDVGGVFGRLVLEVDVGDLLVELGGAVALLLGVEVELEDPQRSEIFNLFLSPSSPFCELHPGFDPALLCHMIKMPRRVH